jgi:hypothetical protein
MFWVEPVFPGLSEGASIPLAFEHSIFVVTAHSTALIRTLGDCVCPGETLVGQILHLQILHPVGPWLVLRSRCYRTLEFAANLSHLCNFAVP